MNQGFIRKKGHAQHGTLTELNITPLLDLVMVLLVIFIITTPQLANDMEMNLPSPTKSKSNQPPPKINRISVAANGSVQLNRQPVTLEALRGMLAALKKENTDVAVVVAGASNADYQLVVNVLDLLQQADITKVGLATDTIR